MPIQVYSEIAPLRRVLLHRPGQELEHLVPGSLERLLFDDIPYLKGAQAEHDRFAQVLRDNGVEVVYLSKLTAEALSQDKALKEAFIRDFTQKSGSVAHRYERELQAYLGSIEDVHEMVLQTMAGIPFSDLALDHAESLTAMLHCKADFALEPIPNLYFTRDPFASVGGGVALHRMYSATRRRETLYGAYILQHHPEYAGTPFYYTPDSPYSLEGGDVMNLSESVLAVGISQRTMPEAIEQLARNVFRRPESKIRTILAMSIPSKRAFMHLDTVMTQVDVDKFVVHPAILPTLRIFEVTQGKGGELTARQLDMDLAHALAHYLHLDQVTLILCGGQDQIAAQREQWNDGSNTLCIRPGVVIAYDRNYITNEILESYGITVLKIPSGELSRGRGGPRCMSMPLIRDVKF
ncbi:MAG: arginine deiminase [Oscillospiraceae bacterium]|mgnify:FL=1|nr:MAG: arginine deiminase [Firmicutes bacterium CAG:137_57_8]CDB31260.1 arginine deiminase [Firmicutes bacterium CAG:137]